MTKIYMKNFINYHVTIFGVIIDDIWMIQIKSRFIQPTTWLWACQKCETNKNKLQLKLTQFVNQNVHQVCGLDKRWFEIKKVKQKNDVLKCIA